MCHADNEKQKKNKPKQKKTKQKKTRITEGIELSNKERIRNLKEKDFSWYLKKSKAVTINNVKMKKKKEEYFRPTGKLQENKFCSRNFIKAINTKVVPIVRESKPLFNKAEEELQQMDKRTRELITMHKT